MSKEEDEAIKTNEYDLFKTEVIQRIDRQEALNASEHEKTRCAFKNLEGVVIKGQGGSVHAVHNVLQDIALAFIAFFAFRR